MADTHLPDASNKTAKAERKPRKAPTFTPRPPFFFELSRLMVVAIMGSSGRLVSRAQQCHVSTARAAERFP